jgi:hypothetical protein
MYSFGGVKPPEGHFHTHTYLELVNISIGHYAEHPASALEIDHANNQWWVEGRCQSIHGIGKNRGSPIRKPVSFKIVFGVASGADPLRRELRIAALLAFRALETQVLILLSV